MSTSLGGAQVGMSILVVVLSMLAVGTAGALLVWRRPRRTSASTVNVRGAAADALAGQTDAVALAAVDGMPPAPHANDTHAQLAALMFRREVPAAATATAAGLAINDAARRVLERIESQPRYMPRRPQVLPQLMRAVNDPEASGRAIAGIIQRDPALAGNLLRIANSAFYRVQARPVESLERAVALVGTDGLRQIVASALVQPVGGVGGGTFGTAMGVAWDETQLSALATAEFARQRGEDAFAAHLLALLHGLGATVVLQVLRDQYARRPGQAVDVAACIALLQAETAATAGRIARAWQLTARMDRALAEQRPGAARASADTAQPMSTLGRALELGRLAGSLAMLVRAGRVDNEQAEAVLADTGETALAPSLLARLTREAA